jgi:hypothetical protein
VVAVAPGAAGPTDGASRDGMLDSLFESGAGAGETSRGRARTGPAEARTTTINLSGGADDPIPGRRPGAVPIRDIVGARPRTGRWTARARRSARVGGWAVGAATVGAGLLALWVLLFSSVSGGDVWLGHPLGPASKDEPARQNAVDPAGSGAASVAPRTTAAAKPTATSTPGAGPASRPSASRPSASRSSAEATHDGGGSTAPTSGGTATSGRNGADDPAGDDSGGHGGGSGSSGSGSGSGGDGSDD